MRTWSRAEVAELVDLFHLASTALAGRGRSPSRYERRVWASARFAERHPEVSSTAAYKFLVREDSWRFR